MSTAAVRLAEEATAPGALHTHRATATVPRGGCRACEESRAHGAGCFYLSLCVSLLYMFSIMNSTGTEVRVPITNAHTCLHGGRAMGKWAPGARPSRGGGKGLWTWRTRAPPSHLPGGGVQALNLGPCASPSPCGTCSPSPGHTRQALPRLCSCCQQLQASD